MEDRKVMDVSSKTPGFLIFLTPRIVSPKGKIMGVMFQCLIQQEIRIELTL